ncbi:hypothetical protein V8C86DRAFT_3028077, partial [Haematococcus lacustris]
MLASQCSRKETLVLCTLRSLEVQGCEAQEPRRMCPIDWMQRGHLGCLIVRCLRGHLGCLIVRCLRGHLGCLMCATSGDAWAVRVCACRATMRLGSDGRLLGAVPAQASNADDMEPTVVEGAGTDAPQDAVAAEHPISEGGNPPAETPHAGAALAASSSASPPKGAAEVAGTAGQAKASSEPDVAVTAKHASPSRAGGRSDKAAEQGDQRGTKRQLDTAAPPAKASAPPTKARPSLFSSAQPKSTMSRRAKAKSQ